jgi:dienelactone hydrolase
VRPSRRRGDRLGGKPSESGPVACCLFGASTGAAAALIAAAERPEIVRAVISRSGRPDLAGYALPQVQAPTLLIVGGDDEPVIELNRAAMRRMRAPVQLEIVPGATHAFEIDLRFYVQCFSCARSVCASNAATPAATARSPIPRISLCRTCFSCGASVQ